jgi:hypothetical protein
MLFVRLMKMDNNVREMVKYENKRDRIQDMCFKRKSYPGIQNVIYLWHDNIMIIHSNYKFKYTRVSQKVSAKCSVFPQLAILLNASRETPCCCSDVFDLDLNCLAPSASSMWFLCLSYAPKKSSMQ